MSLLKKPEAGYTSEESDPDSCFTVAVGSVFGRSFICYEV